MISPLILVSVGGAVGAALRFIISKVFISSSPVFTYVALVNIIGCLIAGMLAAYMDRHVHSEAMRIFLITGILGGFTTFSAFSLDTLNLINKGRGADAIIYVLISVIGSILAAVIGYMVIKWLIR